MATLAIAGALMAAWTGWFLLAKITLFEVTEQARVQAGVATYPVEAVVPGRVLSSHLDIGRQVKGGEVLVELDARPEQLRREEDSARLAGLVAQVGALRAQAAAEEATRGVERRSSQVAAEQARAQERAAMAPSKFSADEAERLKELHRQGLIASRDLERGRAEADAQRAAAEASRLAALRIEQEQRVRDGERDARLGRIQADLRELEGQAESLRASEARLRNEVERRLLRAPVSGRLGEVKALRPGAFLKEGERVAAIVTADDLAVVAQFPPETAIGRLRPGQRARLRLNGFPWTQYGAVEAKVTRVADEIRDGSVRVELAVNHAGSLRIPLQHGMAGSLEVEVERVAPAALMLRLAGQWITAPRDPGRAQARSRSGLPNPAE
ncbi:MAG: HlyD family efflux transporter periplasmic adaptor subunit [Acidobacteria bacterium]|nr:HlyD family efflux transporter periplasmic adaptor subunit [Acidobacteriota bacterium]